jgi:HTH-type transcriptional regulator/antitoxin HigA
MSRAINSAELDGRKYGRLLARTLPRAIKTEEENERAISEIERLMDKGEENLSPEEENLLELLTVLVEKFEDEHYEISDATPAEVIKMLMEERGLRQRDLLPILGSSGVTSEVVTGKRRPSKTQARALARFFRVSPEVFI